MGREPRVAAAPVALAGIDVGLAVNVLTVSVDDAFTIEGSIFLKRIVRPEPVGIDSQRLLLAARQQESDHQFIRRFRWHRVALTGTTINQNEYWRLVFVIGAAPARGQATRARRSVALAALLPGRDVHFTNLDWTNENEGGPVQRSHEALDALMDGLVGDVDLSVNLLETRVEPQKRVDREQPFSERDLRVSEDRVGLVVEYAVAILTEIPLKRPIAAVLT